SARILSARNVVKPPTRARSRAASGRRAVPGTPTTRSPAPTEKAISVVSAVRQTMRCGKSTPVLPYIASAAGPRPLDVGEMTEQQPARQGLHEGARPFQANAARAHRLAELDLSHPDAGQGGGLGRDEDVHVETRILRTD